DVRTIPDALNAALAVADNGRLGLLCQQLAPSPSGPTPVGPGPADAGADATALAWETHLEQIDGTSVVDDKILGKVLDNDPSRGGLDPYLGDFGCLLARGALFHGVFCSSNGGVFPNGVSWLRNTVATTDPTHRVMMDRQGITTVPYSIDPF